MKFRRATGSVFIAFGIILAFAADDSLSRAAEPAAPKGRWFNSKLRMHVYELRDAPFGSNELYEYHCIGATTGDDRPGVFIPEGIRWAVHPLPDFDSAL